MNNEEEQRIGIPSFIVESQEPSKDAELAGKLRKTYSPRNGGGFSSTVPPSRKPFGEKFIYVCHCRYVPRVRTAVGLGINSP